MKTKIFYYVIKFNNLTLLQKSFLTLIICFLTITILFLSPFLSQLDQLKNNINKERQLKFYLTSSFLQINQIKSIQTNLKHLQNNWHSYITNIPKINSDNIALELQKISIQNNIQINKLHKDEPQISKSSLVLIPISLIAEGKLIYLLQFTNALMTQIPAINLSNFELIKHGKLYFLTLSFEVIQNEK